MKHGIKVFQHEDYNKACDLADRFFQSNEDHEIITIDTQFSYQDGYVLFVAYRQFTPYPDHIAALASTDAMRGLQ